MKPYPFVQPRLGRSFGIGVTALSLAVGSCDGRAPLPTDQPAGQEGATSTAVGPGARPTPVVVGPCSDRDGDGTCDEQDVCPLGDDSVDGNGNGFADACEYLLGFLTSSSDTSQRNVPARVSFFMRYDDGREPRYDSGPCKGVRLGNGTDVDMGFRGQLDLTAAIDPAFDLFMGCMTDGIQQYMWTGFDGDDASGFANGSLDRPTGKLDDGAPDLAGSRILYVRLVVIQTDATPSAGLTRVIVRYRWEFYGYRLPHDA